MIKHSSITIKPHSLLQVVSSCRTLVLDKCILLAETQIMYICVVFFINFFLFCLAKGPDKISSNFLFLLLLIICLIYRQKQKQNKKETNLYKIGKLEWNNSNRKAVLTYFFWFSNILFNFQYIVFMSYLGCSMLREGFESNARKLWNNEDIRIVI